MLAHSFFIESSSKLLVTRIDIKARTSSILGLWFPWPIYMFLKWDLTLAHWTPVCNCCSLGYLFIYPTGRKRVCEIRFVSTGENWEKPLSGLQETIFFVIARHVPVECMVSTLLRPYSIVRYFNRVWITRSEVFTRLWCFRMLNVDKMKHWNSSRVQERDRFQNQSKTSLKC